MRYTKHNVLRGMIVYPLGDSVAALLLHEFTVVRLVGMMIVGGFIYSFEIPAWFSYINRKYNGIKRALMAIVFFNPIWIARHLLFILLFSGKISTAGWGIMAAATKSFLWNLPFTLIANYLIQNKISLQWRFFASATLSSAMVIYYALSWVIFK